MTSTQSLHLLKGHIKLSPKVCPKEVYLIQWDIVFIVIYVKQKSPFKSEFYFREYKIVGWHKARCIKWAADLSHTGIHQESAALSWKKRSSPRLWNKCRLYHPLSEIFMKNHIVFLLMCS